MRNFEGNHVQEVHLTAKARDSKLHLTAAWTSTFAFLFSFALVRRKRAMADRPTTEPNEPTNEPRETRPKPRPPRPRLSGCRTEMKGADGSG